MSDMVIFLELINHICSFIEQLKVHHRAVTRNALCRVKRCAGVDF
jgi:hypothetical protein